MEVRGENRDTQRQREEEDVSAEVVVVFHTNRLLHRGRPVPPKRIKPLTRLLTLTETISTARAQHEPCRFKGLSADLDLAVSCSFSCMCQLHMTHT